MNGLHENELLEEARSQGGETALSKPFHRQFLTDALGHDSWPTSLAIPPGPVFSPELRLTRLPYASLSAG